MNSPSEECKPDESGYENLPASHTHRERSKEERVRDVSELITNKRIVEMGIIR